ncbi:VPS37B subunit of ESCRT-I a [Chanos chanos]|uniref:VPS37B subunit of ESCRT-I a n=1 Tax=Chanos chanos TaxID=29144 RepID=A0A6J2WSH5_CHACN|nr:vacuolar protein sorting-associated protein 37B [Chanos chanos]
MAGFGNKLSAYSMTQLNELLEDDEKLNKIIKDMDEIKDLQQSKEMTLASNRSLAEQNLTLQPRLDHQKNQLTKRYRSLQELYEAYQLHKSSLEHKSGNSSLDTLLALLQAEGAKIEEETEIMADAFLDGEVTLDTFIDEYQSKRKLAHLRRVKIDKLQELVLKGPIQSPQSQDHSAKPVQSFQPENTASTPVPLPRRAPPLPPVKSPPAPAPVPQPAAFSYPPIPPRVGHPLPPANINQGYPASAMPFMPQYPPAIPQRPPQRMAPQPGFILQ